MFGRKLLREEGGGGRGRGEIPGGIQGEREADLDITSQMNQAVLLARTGGVNCLVKSELLGSAVSQVNQIIW